jgi:hypothetical protein
MVFHMTFMICVLSIHCSIYSYVKPYVYVFHLESTVEKIITRLPLSANNNLHIIGV